MKLREILINSYGPISYGEPLKPGNISLLWGENEDGKTLTIEAILKLLLGKKFKRLKNWRELQRVEENPVGRITVERNGELLVFPSSGSITDHIDVSPEMFRDLFVITNSDLVIPEEAMFYRSISERLTGLNRQRIDEIVKNIRVIGKITPKGDFQNTEDTAYLRKRFEKAEEFLKEAEDFIGEARSKGYDRLEEKLVALREERDNFSRQIILLEEARKREHYRKNMDALLKLKSDSSRLEELKSYNDDELNKLKRAVERIDESKARIASLKSTKAMQSERIEKYRSDLESRNVELKVSEDKLKKVEDNLKEPVRKYHGLVERKSVGETLSGILMISILIFTGLGALFQFVSALTLLAVGFAVLAVASLLVYLFWVAFPRSRLKKSEAALLNAAAELGFIVSDVNKLQSVIDSFESEVKKQGEFRDGLEKRITGESYRLKNMEEEISGLEESIRRDMRMIEAVLKERGVGSIEDYEERLKEKRGLEAEVRSYRRTLETELGTGGATTDEALSTWEERLTAIRKAIEKETEGEDESETGIRFSESTFEEAKRKLSETEREIEETERELKGYSGRLNYFDRRANEILLDSKQFAVEALEDLVHAREAVADFRSAAIRRRKAAVESINLLEDIAREDEDKIRKLFGRESAVSRFFAGISGGLYREVDYDAGREDQKIRVWRRDGVKLEPGQLSGGAYDQLYFAIRLAFAESLFGEEKGFFILDDPFLKSDRKRFERQMGMLFDLAGSGWQILYLSAKDEVLKAFKGRGGVTMLPPPAVDFKA